MRRARYEILGDGTFYGEIPGLQGVYANAETLEDCREQLRKVLEGWIVLGLRLGHIPPSSVIASSRFTIIHFRKASSRSIPTMEGHQITRCEFRGTYHASRITHHFLATPDIPRGQ